MSLKLTFDDREFQRAVDQLGHRDVKIAAAWALNDTAAEVLTHMQDRMRSVFDRPTRFTVNAFMVMRAKPGNLEAVVQERPSVGARHYLKVQEAGGARGQTGFERAMAERLPFSGPIQSIIPADSARLDAFGNWSTGERNQVMSALRVQRDGASNETEASRKRKRGKRATYFVPKKGLTPAIYKREVDGTLGIVAVISSKVPVYQQRLGFYDGVGDVYAAKFPAHLERTLGKMLVRRGVLPG